MTEAPQVARNLNALASHLEDAGPTVIGRHQDVVSLGRRARDALSGGASYDDSPLGVAQRCADVFAGANLMAKYVHDHYTN